MKSFIQRCSLCLSYINIVLEVMFVCTNKSLQRSARAGISCSWPERKWMRPTRFKNEQFGLGLFLARPEPTGKMNTHDVDLDMFSVWIVVHLYLFPPYSHVHWKSVTLLNFYGRLAHLNFVPVRTRAEEKKEGRSSTCFSSLLARPIHFFFRPGQASRKKNCF